MAGSVEENIQFSLEAIDLDQDIEMTDELFRNEDVQEDCVLSEEEISSFEITEEETSVSIPPVVFIDEENITFVVVENKMNSHRCNNKAIEQQPSHLHVKFAERFTKYKKNLAKHYITCEEKHK